jgi:hypothetical protein
MELRAIDANRLSHHSAFGSVSEGEEVARRYDP